MDFITNTIFKFLQRAGAPPLFNDKLMTLLADRPPMPAVTYPDASFASARRDPHGRLMPQAIAHRGFNARYPENTMASFRGAVDAGAHAVETDVHLSKDGVVMLSHDGDLKRCFGVDRKILESTREELKQYQTIAEPKQQMPTMQDLLEYLTDSAVKDVWLMLDIKLDNNADDIMRIMAETVNSVSPAKGTKWQNRIVLGCWAAKYIPLCDKYFPGYPVCNIGFSVPYSQQFLDTPNVAFSMLIASLVGPFGRWFIHKVKSRKRRLYSWTVNHEKTMDWCIRHEMDGVISDDPEKFLKVCEAFKEHDKPGWPWKLLIGMTQINIFATIFTAIFWHKHGFGLKVNNNAKKKV